MKSQTIKNSTTRIFAIVMVMLCSICFAIAQPGFGGKMTVTGYILDHKTGEPLIAATVQATSSNGGTSSFAIADDNGKFSLEVPRPGKYTLTFNYVGYQDLIKDINIAPNKTNIGKFNLKEDPHLLKEVETIGHSERIKQRGDTIAYNADAYKVQDGATADQLVAKMPGIQVTSDGVTAHGETVEKILVDGKEFFDNDLKLALKSLPAEIIESVQVYDKKSDQAEFTGIDDGETVKAMDLTTKSFSRNGTFGKIVGGVGNNFDWDKYYWDASTNLTFRNGDRSVTIQGMSNNVNKRNFSNDDMEAGAGMMMGRMWQPSGVARTNGLGINYTDVFANNKVDIQLSYFFNNGHTYSTDSTYTDDLTRDYSSFSSSNSSDTNTSHRIGGRISYKPSAKDEIMIRPSINFQTRNGNGASESRNWNLKLEDVWYNEVNTSLWDRDLFSQSLKNNESESDSWNVRSNILWRHKLDKPGRTLSMNFNLGTSSSDSESFSGIFRKNKAGEDYFSQTYGQQNNNDNKNSNLSGNIQWTEPIVTGLNLSLRYDVNYSKSERTTSIDSLDINKYDDWSSKTNLRPDVNNSNKYEQSNLRNSAEIGFSYNKGTLRINAQARFQSSHLEGEQNYYLLPKGNANTFSTSKNYFSVLPNFRLEYRTSGGTMFRLNYRVRTSNPSVNNLQSSINTSNPYSYSTGNPNLDQSTSHSINGNMMWTNTETAQNFMIFTGLSMTQDQISTQVLRNLSSEVLDLTDVVGLGLGFDDDVFKGVKISQGGSISRPINRNGSKSVMLGLNYGFPLDLIMSNVNISLRSNASINPSNKLTFEGYETLANGTRKATIQNIESKTSNYGLSPDLNISSNISTDLNFTIHYSPSFQWVKDTQTNVGTKNYLNQIVSADLNWTFWNGFTTDQSISYSHYGGSAMDQSISECIWNASIGKKFLKGKVAEIKLQAYDILGSNKGYSRTVGTSNISTSYRNFMPRYFMVTFTYNVRAYKTGGKQSTRTEDEGMRGMGHGPGMGGGPMGGGPGGRF